LQTCGRATINSRPHQYKFVVGALPNGWVDVVASNAEATTQPNTLLVVKIILKSKHKKDLNIEWIWVRTHKP
jgi:hypothetical protein